MQQTIEPVRIRLSYQPREWQRTCHAKKRRFKVLALHRRAGKTELALQQLFREATSPSFYPQRLYIYMAPFLKQAKLIAWSRMKQIAAEIPGTDINESELTVTVPNGAVIRVFGGDNPDAARGVRLDGCVMDEVAQMKPEVWNEIVQPALSDRLGWALFIGTPKGINMFSELFNKANALPDWWSARYTVYDTDALDPAEVARLQRDMPDNEFRREYLCDFSAAAENQLMSVGDIEEAAQRHLRTDQYDSAALVVGCDPARFGDDSSVICFRQGLHCEAPIVLKGIDNMALAGRLASEVIKRNEICKRNRKGGVAAVFIDVGNGSGVIDRMRQLGHSVIEVNFGGRADSPRYINKRTEMWYRIREWLDSGGAIPPAQEMKQDLATPTFSYDNQGRICLETKDEIKKRIQRSPDCGDALALTFASFVMPSIEVTDERLLARNKNADSGAYDPFARENF